MHKSKCELFLSSAQDRFKNNYRKGIKVYWCYLGRNYVRLLALKKIAPDNATYIDLGEGLFKTATRLRRPYLDYLGTLSQRLSSLSWWCSSVSEKNTMVSPVFLYLCYINELKTWLSKNKEIVDLHVFSDSPALLRTIAELSELENFNVKYLYNLPWWNNYVFVVKQLIVFILNCLKQKKVHRFSCHYPITIIRTWVSESSFGENYEFRDNYFKDLAEKLHKKNENIVILPIFFNLKRSVNEAIDWCLKSNRQFIFPHSFYRISDYFFAIVNAFKILFIFNQEFSFREIRLSYLFREDVQRNAFGIGRMGISMHYLLIKRLIQKRIRVKRCIFTFENMAPEKPLIMGFQRFSSQTKTIGYQHTCLFPLLLSSYSSLSEQIVLPQPDKIVCSGPVFRDILAREGFRREKLVVGPALRFQYLLNDKVGAKYFEGEQVLITLPLIETSACELLDKTYQALKFFSDLKTIIKPHPMMSDLVLLKIIKCSGFESNQYKISKDLMSNVLPKAKLLIATASATLFDAVAFGVPTIRLRSELDLMLDPLDWFPKSMIDFVARKPSEIVEKINHILALNNQQRQAFKEFGNDLIPSIFVPTNKTTILAFEADYA